MRQPESNPQQWQVSADVECMAWDPHNTSHFAVSAEDGSVALFDVRQGSNKSPVEIISAHQKAVSALSFCPAMSGVLATGSTDATVKLWKRGDQGKHNEVDSKQMGVGAIFSAGYSRDSPMLLAAGGANGSISVWDTSLSFDKSVQ